MILATLLVKNEEEIVEDCILHHLNHGVDKFIVTDNNSDDNTKAIISKFREVIKIIDEPGDGYEQGMWVSRMSVMACDYKPEWVVHLDADEFWYGLKNLKKVPKATGIVYLPFHYYEHLITQEYRHNEFRREMMPYFKVTKSGGRLVHRPHRESWVVQGNHRVMNHPMPTKITVGDHLVMHHYSNRCYDQFERKVIQGGVAYEKYTGDVGDGSHWRMHYQRWKDGTLRQFYEDELFLTQQKIETGLADGTILKFNTQVTEPIL